MEGPTGRKATGGESGSRAVGLFSVHRSVGSTSAVVLLALLIALPLPVLLAHPGLARAGGPTLGALGGPRSPDLQVVPPNLFNESLSANVPDVSTAYDPQTGTVIAVAENLSSANTFFQPLETWTYSAGQWSQLAPSASPPARIGASLVFDPQLGSIVLFGGLGPSGLLSDTWSFSGGTWTNISATTGVPPSSRASGSFVWDSEDSEAVLFGGIGMNGTDWYNASTGNTSTWLFGSSGWTEVAQPSATVPNALGAVAYDTLDGYVLDFGGVGNASSCNALSTTYEFHRGRWTDMTSTVLGAPSGRWSASAVYDPATSSVILFGGLDCLTYRNDTWSYASGHWSEVSSDPSAPSQRAASMIVDDPSASTLLLYGGIGVNGPQGDTWTFGGMGWVLEGPVLSAVGGVLPGRSLVTDAGANLTVAVEGALAAGTANYAFFNLPPGCPVVDAPTFECAATQPGRYVMSGLVSSSAGESPLPAVTLFVNPPPTFASIILSATATETGVPVTIRDSVLGGTGNYSYQYLGLPQGCQSEDVPVLTCDPTEVGSFNVGIAAIDSVGVKAFETEPLVVGPHPFVQAVLASRATLDVGLATELSVVAGGGVGPLTFAYSGLPDGCASSNTTGLSCAPSANGTFTVQVSASDQFGYSASGSVRFTVHPRLVAPTFTANSSSVHLGDNVSFTLSVSGGTAPYRYIYTGLPTGCSTLNDSAIQCDPRATGHFVVRVTVTDDFGESVTDNTTLTVDLRTGLVTNPGPASGGGSSDPLWLAVTLAAVVVVAASTVAIGLVLRRNRRFAFEGRQIVAQLLDDAPALGDEFGRFDDPTRPQ